MSELSQDKEIMPQDLLSRPVISALSLDVEKTIYVVIIVLALLTRLWNVGDRVVSHDESLHTQYSYQYYNGDGYQHTPLMHGPSLFHITALSYWLFGDSDTSARIPVAIIGTMLVVLPYLFRGWIGRLGALSASLMLLISPYITYYSRYIRHDIYVITAAVITFAAINFYLRENKDKYLWWFAIGMGLMFTTMETSYIYVAIFGSFLAIKLVAKTVSAEWFRERLPVLTIPIVLVAAALILFGIGFAGQRWAPRVLGEDTTAATVETDEGFAADPSETLTAGDHLDQDSGLMKSMRWLQVGSLFLLAGGLFLVANRLRPFIDEFREFDLVILFTTLTLPAATAFLITTAGGDPLAYTLNTCQLAGQETMSGFQIFFARLFNATCLSSFLSSAVVLSGAFLVLTLVISVLVGLWWNLRRWLVAACIFHGIFIILFTSFFTNPSGWASGMIGSLGYWLAQQEVQRANQPTGFYFLVLPLYEFLPLIFTLLAAHLWAKKNRLSKILGYWLLVSAVALLAYSLSNWFFNRNVAVPDEINKLPGQLIAVLIIVLGILYYVLIRHRQIVNQLGPEHGWRESVDLESLFGFVPYLLWWILTTWVIYSMAGEKMAWLSTHFIFSSVLLAGWYLNDRFVTANLSELLTRRFALLTGLAMLLFIAVGMALAPLILDHVSLGNQEARNLAQLGRILGGLIIVGLLVYFFWKASREFERGTVRRAWLLAVLLMLALLTIRFTYMAAFVNADYVTEYLVYAHGAPATKSQVLTQLEGLSLRLHGDKSIKVAFDNDSSWPFTWYLRDYPNRIYFGENPGRNITEAPVVIVGSQNWGKVEPILGDDYDSRTYTFLWWPMEEYRKVSWNAALGDPTVEPEFRRGLGDPDVRRALWDIFFYRDFEKYGEVFGGNYSAGQWPLRHDLRMYIRKDNLATLWDHGIDALAAEPPVDPYAENEFQLVPTLVIGSPGSADGQLQQPRNVAISSDGLIFVVDSGNHRIQVFGPDGQFIRNWGAFGGAPGLFNEPWGLAVDDQYVYVADTWNHRLQKFTYDGELIGVIGQSGSPAAGQIGGGLFFGPRDIVILNDGNLLVTDTGNHRMQILDKDGNFIDAIGSQGNLPGQMYEPVGIDIEQNGSVFLADTWNSRIQEFNADFLPVNEWPVDAWFGESINNKPYLTVDNAGHVFITDPEGYRVIVFDQSGQFIGRFGSYSSETDGFGLPNGIEVDSEGNLYVVDAGNSRILKYAPFTVGSSGTLD